MATWKTVQESIKNSMKELGELYESQIQERKELQQALKEQMQEQMQEQIQTLQDQVRALQKENALLKKKNQEFQNKIEKQDAYIKDIEENNSPDEELDETFQMRLGIEKLDTESDSLRQALEEAEKKAEEARLEEEAQRILEVQKEREREYQQRLWEAENLRKQEEEAKRLAQEKEQIAKQKKKALEDDEKKRTLEKQKIQKRNQLEKSFSEVCAQIGLVEKKRQNNPQVQDLLERFSNALAQIEGRISNAQAEYKQAKSDLEQRIAKDFKALDDSAVQSGFSADVAQQIEDNQTEISILIKKISEIDSRLSGFWVGGKSRLEQERGQYREKIDELETKIHILKQTARVSTPLNNRQEKREELHKQKEMFELQWKQHLSSIETEVSKERQSLESQKEREMDLFEKSVVEEKNRLEQKKKEIEALLEQLS